MALNFKPCTMKKILLFGLLLNVGSAFSQNPIAYYKFNDTLESSGANNHLTRTGAGTNCSFIKQSATKLATDSCVSFNFGQGLVSANSLNNQAWTGTTISFWYNSNHPSTTGFIIQGASIGFGVKMIVNGRVGAFFSGAAANAVYSNALIDDGVWHHVVAQTNGTTTTSIYIDGKLDNSQAETSYHMSGPNPAAKLYFGTTIANNAADKLIGKVDELKLYDYALTLPQITALYQYGFQLPFPENQSQLVHYKFTDTLENSGTENYLLPSGSTAPYAFNNPGATGYVADSFVNFSGGTGLRTVFPLYNRYWAGTAISFWYNSTTFSSGFVAQGAFTGFGVRTETNGKVSVFFDGTAVGSLISTSVLNDGVWHHVVAQNNGVKTSLFIDGVFDKSQAEVLYHMPFIPNLGALLYFGNSQSNNVADKLYGKVDEFRLFRDTLNQANITALYQYGNQTVGLDEHLTVEASIFPNPTGSLLNIKTLNTVETVLIYNIVGALVQTENKNTFSVENLPAGIYILQIKTAKGNSVARFIKE